jgi:hypothetical protein
MKLAMEGKISFDEFCARGGKSKSPRKMAAIEKNLQKAREVRAAKCAERRCSKASPP